MSIVVHVDLSGLERRTDPARRVERQVLFAQRAALLMEPFVPLEEGTLRGSEPVNSNYAAGHLVWNTPYAAKHYYVPMRHTVAGTTDHWDIAMVGRSMGELKEFVASLYTEGS